MHSPEPCRDISLGSSQIPRICVLWETQTRLTVAPARPPVPGPRLSSPSDLRTPRALVSASQRPRPSALPPGRRAKGGTAFVGSRRGRRGLSDPRPEHSIRPARPSPGRPEWGRGPTRPDPQHPASDGALTQRVVLLEHPLHGGGGEGMQPALGAAEFSEPTTTTTTAAAAAAATTRQAGFPAAGA